MNIARWFLLCLAVCLTVSGCSLLPLQTPQATPQPPIPPGSEWELQTLNAQPALAGAILTLSFENDELSGFAGCNDYGGPYTAGNGGAFQAGEIEIQQERCAVPSGVMRQEEEFIQALQAVDTFSLSGNNLELWAADGSASLRFVQRLPLNMDPAMLEGVTWKLQRLGSYELVEGTNINIQFKEGAMNGSAGCRAYHGLYQAAGDQITFSYFNMLGNPLCSDEALFAQETRYLDMLERATHYEVRENELRLYISSGEVLLYAAE